MLVHFILLKCYMVRIDWKTVQYALLFDIIFKVISYGRHCVDPKKVSVNRNFGESGTTAICQAISKRVYSKYVFIALYRECLEII